MKEEITKFTLDMIGDFIQSKADTLPLDKVDLDSSTNWITAQMAKQLFPEMKFIWSDFFNVRFDNNKFIDIHYEFINFADHVETIEGCSNTVSWKRLNELFKEWVSRPILH